MDMNSLTTIEQIEELIIANYPDQTDYWLYGKGKHTPISLTIKCPHCGHETPVTIKGKLDMRRLLKLDCPGCEAHEGVLNKHLEIPLPFGKYRGRTINSVMECDPTYLAWFVDNIKRRDDLVAQIKTHTRFAEAWKEYLAKPKIPKAQREAREWQDGRFSQQTIDDLFDAFFGGLASR
jgi:hypothetical protein